MSKRVLIFSYYWPPAGGVAVQRVLRFVKYLPQFGWEPVVITVKDGSYAHRDEALLNEVPAGIQVYRTDTTEPFAFYNFLRGTKGKTLPIAHMDSRQKGILQRLAAFIRANFFIPDARVGWVRHAVRQAETIIRQQKIDAIFISSPPHSSQLIGLELKKRYHIPWLADFRDPWSKIFLNEFLPRSSWTVRKDAAMEQSVLQKADAVTVIGDEMKNDFSAFAPKITVLPNGFDEDDFRVAPIADESSFTLRYVGNLLTSENVPSLWNVIHELCTEDAAFSRCFRLQIIGNASQEVKSSIAEAGIGEQVQYVGFIPHAEAVAWMKGATALLLIIPKVANNRAIITGKLFEYLAAKRPVLSIGPLDGNAARILNETERGAMIRYVDSASMKNRLKNLFDAWQEKQNLTMQNDAHLRYSRKNQTGKLAELLDALAAKQVI